MGQRWRHGRWPVARGEGNGVMEASGLWVTKDRLFPCDFLGPLALRSPPPSKEAPRPSQNKLLGTSAHTIPCANTLSASVIGLENISTSFKTHLWVSFLQFCQTKGSRRYHRARCAAPREPLLDGTSVLCVLKPLPQQPGADEGRRESQIRLSLVPSTGPGLW